MIRVVLTDDEPNVLNWLYQYVDWEYYNCRVAGCADSGAKALDILSNEGAELLITDISMPDMNGLELIRQAKALLPELRVIIISAYSKFDYVKDALKLGVENYLLKPIDVKELSETLKKTIDNMGGASYEDAEDISIFRNNILQRWIHNTLADHTLKDQAAFAGINLSAESYTVLILRAQSGESGIEASVTLYQACRNHPAGGRYCFVDGDSLIVNIVYGDGEFVRKAIHSLTESLCQMPEFRDAGIVAVAGVPVHHYTDVCISYDTAVRYLPAVDITGESLVFAGDYPFANYLDSPAKNKLMMLKSLVAERNVQYAYLHATGIISQEPKENRFAAAVSIVVYIVEFVNICDNGGEMPPVSAALRNMFKRDDRRDPGHEIYALISLLFDQASEAVNLIHPLLRQVLNIIREEYGDGNLSISALAGRIGVSAAYLGQMFRLQTGKYFNDYLQDVRLDASLKILAETDVKIGDIAAEIGFGSQSYMNRVFKKKYKQSPLEYRRDIRQNQ